MITLVEIANRLKDKVDYDFNSEDERKRWEPIRATDYVVPSFNITESQAKGAKAKLRMKLSKVLAFIDSVKHKRFKDGCTIMPISVTNKDNLAIWDSEKSVSRAIAYMIEIGLISVENDRYQFGAYYEKDNRSKSYYYYKENEDKIKAYCISNNIEMFVVKNKIYDIKEIESLHTEIDCDKVRFAKTLKLVKPTNLSKSDFEKQLTLCLYKNYPALAFHIEKANEINENYYAKYPEFRIRFRPNFTWSDDGTYVSGIGIRATNSMTNFKKEKRAEALKAYGFTLEKDINASVPRMTLSLNKGYWVDESIDIYELIFREMEPNGIFTKEIREAIKKLHMRAYFDSSESSVGHHTWLAIDQENVEEQDVRSKMAEFREAIIRAEGGTLVDGSEIFYIESCVYLMTLYDLLTSGHKVWQVYDCFYAKGEETQEDFEDMVSYGVRTNFSYFMETYYK